MLDSIFVGVGPDGLLCLADGDNDLTSFYSTTGTTVVGRNVFFLVFSIIKVKIISSIVKQVMILLSHHKNLWNEELSSNIYNIHVIL